MLGSLAAAACLGVAVAVSGVVALTMLAFPVLVWLATRGTGRLLIFIGGALVVLQGGDGLDSAKLAFLATAIACVLVAVIRLPRTLALPEMREFRWLPLASLVYMTLLLFSFPVAILHGNSATDWLRDIVAYALICVSPIVALDAARTSSRESIVRVVTFTGLIGAVGFSVSWLSRRGVSDLGIDHLGLASIPLCVVPFCYGIVRALSGFRAWRWMLYSTLIFTLLSITGTRTVAVLLLSLLAVVGAEGKGKISIRRAIPALGAVAVVAFGMMSLLGGHFVNDDEFLQQRLSLAADALTGNIVHDDSYMQREMAYSQATEVISESPLLGAGPGHLYTNVVPSKPPTLTLDTPLMMPAKIGILGAGAVLVFVAIVLRMCGETGKKVGGGDAAMTLRASVVVMIGLAPLTALFENKGTGLAMFLLVVLCVVDARSAEKSKCQVSSASPVQTGSRG